MVGTSGTCCMLKNASPTAGGGVGVATQKSLSQNELRAAAGGGVGVALAAATGGTKSLSKNDVHPATGCAACTCGSGACTAAGRVGGGESVAPPPLARRGLFACPCCGCCGGCGCDWLAAKAAKKSSSWCGLWLGAGEAATVSKKDGACGVVVGVGVVVVDVDLGVCAGAAGDAAGAGAGAGVLLSSTHASIEKKSPLPAAAGVLLCGGAAVLGAESLCAGAAP